MCNLPKKMTFAWTVYHVITSVVSFLLAPFTDTASRSDPATPITPPPCTTAVPQCRGTQHSLDIEWSPTICTWVYGAESRELRLWPRFGFFCLLLRNRPSLRCHVVTTVIHPI